MNNGDFFTMSGTSQSAAAVSGVAALVIYNNPGLTPDQVKCRILSSGKPAVDADNMLAYSVLQQGTGVVDAKEAVYGTANNCANQGVGCVGWNATPATGPLCATTCSACPPGSE